jgi:hypothetical protein
VVAARRLIDREPLLRLSAFNTHIANSRLSKCSQELHSRSRTTNSAVCLVPDMYHGHVQ